MSQDFMQTNKAFRLYCPNFEDIKENKEQGWDALGQ
jgi:hypothetical protein